MALIKIELRLGGMKLTRQPTVYRFLDSMLFIANSSRFLRVSLATEKNVIHRMELWCTDF